MNPVGCCVDAGRVPELHLPLLDELGGKQGPGAAVGGQLVHHAAVEVGGPGWGAVPVNEALYVEAGQQPRDEVINSLDCEVRQNLGTEVSQDYISLE